MDQPADLFHPRCGNATGECVITFAQHENSMALLTGDAGIPPIESLARRREAGSTYAPLFYPGTYPARTRLVHAIGHWVLDRVADPA